ncbi:MAG: PA0069 family radical SAM protein [Hyphomicrobiaceae bacterium]
MKQSPNQFAKTFVQDPCDLERNNEPQSIATTQVGEERRRGRGARSNANGRFEPDERNTFDDGWESLATLDDFKTTTQPETVRTIITRNNSPDISFDRSINPYRGCEHGCIYCFARPTHCYLGHSAGLDFETKLYAKTNAAKALEKELAKPGYTPDIIALGANTDPYQPIERREKITRSILEVLQATQHPVGIVTKSAGVLRDLDILSEMAKDGLVKVALSVTTLDRKLARAMEPRAATPDKRIDTIEKLSAAGVPVMVMVAPVIPALNDHEIEVILKHCYEAGAREAGYVMLRLPIELKQLFREWLATDYPDRANRIIGHIQSMHGGKDYSADFSLRQKGQGPYARQIANRFSLASKRLGFNRNRLRLRTDLFTAPVSPGAQMNLF